jgi:hypothetical protein
MSAETLALAVLPPELARLYRGMDVDEERWCDHRVLVSATEVVRDGVLAREGRDRVWRYDSSVVVCEERRVSPAEFAHECETLARDAARRADLRYHEKCVHGRYVPSPVWDEYHEEEEGE